MARPLVLVTGATGFAGSHMVDVLRAADYPVRVLVRRRSNLKWLPAEGVERVSADVCDPGSMAALVADVGWIFHFAALTRAVSRAEYFRVNVEGVRALWTAALRAQSGRLERFVFCSSLAASGPAVSAARPRRESDLPQPITPYGESKLVAERWLEGQVNPASDALPCLLIVRPPAVYGPRDPMTLSFFKWAQRGWMMLPSPRNSRMSLIHARDLCRGALALAERGATGVFNLSDDMTYSWEDVGGAASAALGHRLRRLHVPAVGVRMAGCVGSLSMRLTGRMVAVDVDKARDLLQPYWICDSAKARAAGFEPQIELREGVRETIDWYRAEGWL